MHHIQSKILGKLLYAESLNYAALRPEGIESNHFAYHLEQLMCEGLIAKTDKLYTLSPRGLAYVDRMSYGNMAPRLQPHIATALYITNEAGEALLFQRRFQPYIHRWGLPLGKTHLKETVAEAASRELHEKTGLADVLLRQRGIIYAQTSQEGFVISKKLVHIFSGNIAGKPALLQNERGNAAWANPHELPDDKLMPWLMLALDLLHNTPPEQLFFAELPVNM